jgi:7-cyano-7-deazaguanine reductase
MRDTRSAKPSRITHHFPFTVPTTQQDLSGLTLLGRDAKPSKKLETFPNHNPGRRYTVTLSTDEFTCVCPATGQPDFATITIKYIPDKRILESKSLKLYLWSYRNEGVFHEHVTNTICDDLVKALNPHWIEVTGAFKVRGGISITVVATHKKKGNKR